MSQILAVILGGGKGTRLFPLTQFRSKPAVPVAGKYRIIDIPISNCLNSGINRVYLLTQFNSVSLHRHIRQTYRFDRFDGGFVEILAAQQTMEGEAWYQGTADAVRKNLRYLEQKGVDYVLVLSGDQLYRMDFREMLAEHESADAEVTIAALPCTREQARGFGIMRLDDTGRVLGFLEKPQSDREIDLVRTEPTWIDAHGIASHGRDCLASMGIYLFRRDVLVDLLSKTDYHDFGKEIFPMSIRTNKVQAYLYDGYWEDIGTIRSFYEANIALARTDAPFHFEDPTGPIYTHARSLPPTRLGGAHVHQSLIADGAVLGEGTVVENSVIGLRCRIGNNVTIRNSVIMGADYYQPAAELSDDEASGTPTVGIGDGAFIEGAIIDKNCRVGRNAKIGPTTLTVAPAGSPVQIQDGIIVVAAQTTIPTGWTLT